MNPEDIQDTLEFLESKSVITTEDKNLRSKVDSLTRNLEQLFQKKLRIEFEIKRQKKSLIRKREELKRVSKRNSAKLKLTLEQQILLENVSPEDQLSWLSRLDSKLLQESNQRLEELDS